MLIGIIGAPNKGKSTLFSAITMAEVAIANYPFTTIDPNKGVAYVSKECVDKELKVKCNPSNSLCKDGTRFLPINVVDVAGLVPGAHLGKGMGNQFINDAIAADVLLQVVDLSGKTDLNGNACDYSDPADEVRMIEEELSFWLAGIITKHMPELSRSDDGVEALMNVLSSLKIKKEQVEKAINDSALSSSHMKWNDTDAKEFASSLLKLSKPIVVVANKADQAPKEAFDNLKSRLEGHLVVKCSAALELALKKASTSKMIDYVSGSKSFNILGNPSSEQETALKYMQNFIQTNGTGVQDVLNAAVYGILKLIVAYPVEDENKYTNHYGDVLPDAYLVPEGTTAQQFAAYIHSDLAKHMLYAINAKTKLRIGKDYVLKDNDVLKIVSAAK